MRILYLADGSHPNTLNWARYLASNLGHEVHIASFHKSAPVEGITIHLLGDGRPGKAMYLFGAGKARELIARVRPDLLIGYRLTSYAYVAARTGFRPYVAAAQSQWAGGSRFGVRKPPQWLAAIYAVRKADLILVWADHMKQDVLSLGGDEARILNIPRGVQLGMFPYRPRTSRTPEYTIISTRGLLQSYSHHLAIQAVAELRDRIPELRLLVVGDGPDRGRLEALARERGVGHQVEFAGKVPYDRLGDYLGRADLYLSTVPQDGVSSSLLEAMAAGVYPLVPDIRANRMWEDRGCRIDFFAPENVDALAQRIEGCHRSRGDRLDALRINRDVVQQQASWDTNMKVIDRRLTALCSGSG